MTSRSRTAAVIIRDGRLLMVRQSAARQAGEYAARAGAGRLVLTYLWPGTDRSTARAAARRAYPADLYVATPGMTIGLG